MPYFFPASIHRQGFFVKNKCKGFFINSSLSLFLVVFLTQVGICQQTPPAFNEPAAAPADTTARLYISEIIIQGNKKTKNYIIEREMRFKEGDSVIAGQFEQLVKLSQELVYNTTLFTEVTIQPRFLTGTDVSVTVTVKEKWYIYPTPQFQLTDRSFNEWIKTYNADLERVVYGVKFSHYNLSGRRDQLKVVLLNGYSRNLAVTYSAPYSNRSLTEGFSASASFTQNRELIYKTTSNNNLARYTNDAFTRNNFTASGSYQKRRGFYKRHLYSIALTYTDVADTITNYLNKNFFDNGKSSAFFQDLSYSYQYIHTNNVQYPLSGLIMSGTIGKRGLGWKGGLNMLSLTGMVNKYIDHGRNWYSIVEGQGFLRLPLQQSYVNQRGFGYSDYYLRGLENYVIDGVASLLGRYTFKKKLVSFDIPVPIKNKIVPKIPITLFAKTYADAGYVYNKPEFDSRLGNKFLYSGGFGIDVLTLYDINLKIEYSFNQLGEKGLFLHTRGGF